MDYTLFAKLVEHNKLSLRHKHEKKALKSTYYRGYLSKIEVLSVTTKHNLIINWFPEFTIFDDSLS